MGLFGRKKDSQQELQGHWETYQNSLRQQFDEFIRKGRIGRVLVQAYNQEHGTDITLAQARFSLGRTVSTGQLFIELYSEEGMVRSATLSQLSKYMPNRALMPQEKQFLVEFANNMTFPS